jgi:hypothetical protein
MAKKTTAKHEPVFHSIPIEWSNVDAPVVFANNLVVQVDEHECHLSFFEVKPPLVMGSREEKRKQLKELKSIQARCVVRVVISSDRLASFVEAMQTSQHKASQVAELRKTTDGKDSK